MLNTIHEKVVYGRRIRVLAEALSARIPPSSSVLDVGTGDGQIAHLIVQHRPDISIRGVDVLVRPMTFIPVEQFNGSTLPFDDGQFDCVLFVDVLHHTSNIRELLREARRVSRQRIIIKDHNRNGILAQETLKFMDLVGNCRHGVAVPANYLSAEEWSEAFAATDLRVASMTTEVPLYPFWASWIFGRSLHFIAALERNSNSQIGQSPTPQTPAHA